MPSATICVVDDDESVRKSLCRFFEAWGLAVREYASGKAFLAEMQAPSIGCLVIDFDLPELNGLEILGRAQSQGWVLPVIMITGDQDSSLEERALRSGVWAFLRKPVDPHVLISTIDKAVRGHSKV
jgi:two-component system, LuxR family, response regulator FixJ